MADPELDSDFVYNEQGFIDILRSPFFDLNLEVDDSVEEYVERIIFTLSNAVEEQLSIVQWQSPPSQVKSELFPSSLPFKSFFNYGFVSSIKNRVKLFT
ncbi:hypothetical protein M5K25_017151 [Dendrobium thyrsiflorum]|uniref:Uncharacterized protein n=1 Tax=Dendrobium thyrsiflorum TaxID=117978 RepID=A0ABD0ULZ5_DENTH